ncbi:DegV family protein [Paraliobacillus quinghaiensis]|uniref:DegV family protein n=1 Tax=Paraliobacillus quinghaiensis TaxID=470815 RepID=A0A917TRP0_9BACI|nr:DegV family protein [Paraliobacillus quinghaiensis]GGM34277.1 DegV family protein [Paraliobacillus quinghaiensis]
MQIQLITDSSADLPIELKEKLKIKTIPLYVHFGKKQYASDELDTFTYFKKIREATDFPISSAPGPHVYYELFKEVPKDQAIIFMGISAGISSAYNNAVMAMNLLLEEQPERKIEVINTKTASPGLILLLDEAGKRIEDGYNFDELVKHLYDRVEHTATFFILKTVENLVRGGRLDKVKGAIAKTLNIKLLLYADKNGRVEVMEKIRGDKKSIRRFIAQIGEYVSSAEDKVITLTHCQAIDRANHIIEEINKKYSFKQTILSEIGPVISTHAGEGGIVISFFKDKRD